jgi:WD repeat-containing protein 26
VRRPLVLEKLDREDFPGQLGLFAGDVITFLHCLNEFPEFTDEALNASILAFEGDLKVRAVRDLLGSFVIDSVTSTGLLA